MPTQASDMMIQTMADNEEELKCLLTLMRVKEENEKAGLTLSIQKMKIVASSLITSCKFWIQLDISFPFSLAIFILFFSQLFVKPPQTTTLLSCISFSLGWF